VDVACDPGVRQLTAVAVEGLVAVLVILCEREERVNRRGGERNALAALFLSFSAEIIISCSQ
jgi:multisubunit Na+/H+ antiporter MnhB subunit